MDTDSLLARCSPLIGDRWLNETSAGTTTHVDPSTGKAIAVAHVSGAREIDMAVEAATGAQREWMSMRPAQRVDALLKFADAIEEHAEMLLDILALDAGVPASQGVGLAAAWVRHFAGYADKIVATAGDALLSSGFNYTRKEPYGVVGVIIPWNHPLVATCQVAIPAIAAGNAVVLKPPSITPYTALKLGELALEADLPPGLLSIVPGDAAAGEALVTHPGVGKIGFTGSVATAKQVMAAAARALKPLFLELGGKSANLVFADARLETQVPFSALFSMGLSGQGCVLPTRLLVEAPVYDTVVQGIVQALACLKPGPAIDRETTFGPVISEAACQRILAFIERANAEGEGRLVAGGRRIGGALASGYFIEPTVFADVKPDSRPAREEIFGPVLSIMRFRTEEEALAMANASNLGLGAYIQTSNLERAHRLAARLQAGYVNVNGFSNMDPGAPFGGYKQSGFGRIGGRAGLEEFLQLKNVYVNFS